MSFPAFPPTLVRSIQVIRGVIIYSLGIGTAYFFQGSCPVLGVLRSSSYIAGVHADKCGTTNTIRASLNKHMQFINGERTLLFSSVLDAQR